MTLKDRGLNIIATNNSWGGIGTSQAVEDAIAATMRGILFIVAAGNGGSDSISDDNDLVPTFPANYTLPNVIAVAATDHNDPLANFSNFGEHTVHLGVPGVAILSTIRGNCYGTFNGSPDGDALRDRCRGAVEGQGPLPRLAGHQEPDSEFRRPHRCTFGENNQWGTTKCLFSDVLLK